MHETIEQYNIKINRQNVRAAHGRAAGVERTVTGSYVEPYNRPLTGGQLSLRILGPTGNSIKTVVIYVNNSGNVTGIKR